MAEPIKPRVALDKVTFLMAFVPYLTQVGQVSVAEAARHFGYTEDFVRRSAHALATTGVPGDSAQYLHGDLFDIDYDALAYRDELRITHHIAIEDDIPRLAGREAAALLAGLQRLAHDPVIAASADFKSLKGKLVRSAAGVPEPTAVASEDAANFAPLRAAIADGRQVEFDYRAAGAPEVERRRVDPIRIEAIDAVHHLKAWCHLRGGVRTFRLDRIDALRVLDTPAEHGVGDLDGATAGFTAADDDPVVTIEFHADAQHLVAGYRPLTLEIDPASHRAQMTVAVAAPATVQRIVAEIPGARVVGPDSARHAIHAWAEESLSRYIGAAD